jgi:hypothetical protein
MVKSYYERRQVSPAWCWAPPQTHDQILVCTRCDNLTPGMALWKQNLLTCALAAAVTFEILSLWSYALHETKAPLPETVLKIVFQNTL